jgi:hypothetical protein
MRTEMLRLSFLATFVGLFIVPSIGHATSFSFTKIDNSADPTFNQLLGINDDGVIVGYYGSGAAGHPNIGYEIAAPYTTFAANMKPGSVQTQATGINADGVTTGFWSDTNTGTDANFGFIRHPTGKNFTYISVDDPLVSSTPHVTQLLGINKVNVAAGFYNDAAGNSHGFTYALGTGTYTPITLPAIKSLAATGINDFGTACGFFLSNVGTTVGFLKNSTGVVTKLVEPHMKVTQILGVNNHNSAVGFYFDSKNIPHGLYYQSSTGKLIIVNDPNGVNGTIVNGLNNKNQLVGFYTDAAGNTHGMLVKVTP